MSPDVAEYGLQPVAFIGIASTLLFVGVGACGVMIRVGVKELNDGVSAWEELGELFIAAYALYLFDQILLKVSMALFMLRIVRGRWERFFIVGSMGIYVTYTMVLMLFSLFRCGLPTIPNLVTQACLDKRHILESLNYAGAVSNALIDWILTALPIFVISRLQMPLRAKLSACLLIGLCALGSIVSVVRIAYAAGGVPNPISGFSFFAKEIPFIILSVCETGIGMIAISFAALRPFLLIVWEKAKTVGRTGQELDELHSGKTGFAGDGRHGNAEMQEVFELRTSKSPRCDSFDEEINVWSNITENKRSSYIATTRPAYMDYPSTLSETRQWAVDRRVIVQDGHKSWVASPSGISIDGKSYMDFPSPTSDKYDASIYGVLQSPTSGKYEESTYLQSPTSDKYAISSYSALPSPMSERPISFIALPSPSSVKLTSYLPSFPVPPSQAHVSAAPVQLPEVVIEGDWASEVQSSLEAESPSIEEPVPVAQPRAKRRSLYRQSSYNSTNRLSQYRQSLYRHSQCPYDLYQLGNLATEGAPRVPTIPSSASELP
ncbi:hypothetical protein MBLNU459_g4161t1 [Dothideomycetes sp. NU459]